MNIMILFSDTSTSTAISNIPFKPVSFLVYPNPTSGSLKIDYSLKNKSIIKIELFNILGDKIKIIAEELKDAASILHNQI
ncbi:MAG: T9SS type A sorting domain-containing protein [Bacteroidetes bacterium]|nr:T9SS type A sorting domain-containing protein [Bacteroidota bacterium]